MTSLALLFTLSSIGISETAYLIRKRTASQNPICYIGSGCAQVLNSQYSKTLFIHNDILGLLFYITASVITALLVLEIDPSNYLSLAFKTLVALGSLGSIFLTFIQWRVIKQWCFWCLMSAFTIWLMGVIILTSNAI